MKILVTGGAGYIGTSLVPALLERNYDVTVLDNLMYDQNVLLEYYIKDNFSFVYGDIRDKQIIKELTTKSDVVIHLASIVGAPACKKNETEMKVTMVCFDQETLQLMSKLLEN